MKKLRIRVDDHVYDVTVEVLEDDESANGHAPVSQVHPPSRPPAASASSPPATRPLAENGGTRREIAAPIAGTVQKVFVQAGARVEAKAPVFLLDAMKMDTYIYAPRAGTIANVDVHPGDAVRVGQTLLRYEAEA